MSRKANHPAFTLVELLAVVAIVTALLALLLPSVGAANARARSVVGLSHLRQIGQATFLYTQSWRDQLPPGFDGRPGRATDWAIILDGMLTRRPMDYAGFFAEFTGSDEREITLELFRDPNARLEGGRIHYATNPILMPDVTPGGWPTDSTYRYSRIDRADRQPLIFDAAQSPLMGGRCFATAWAINNVGWTNGTTPVYYDASAADHGETLDRAGPNADGHFEYEGGGDIRYRQDRDTKANVLYADLRASTTGRDEIRKGDVRPDRP